MRVRSLILAVLLVILVCSAVALANPSLQLNILGGTYDTATKTIIASGSKFTLYAYLTPKGNTTAKELNALLAMDYFLSIALVPKVSNPMDLGSFTLKEDKLIEEKKSVTGTMVYGVPPVEYLGGDQFKDSHDLGHTGEIFNTYFYEQKFNFAVGDHAGQINSQDSPGAPLNTTQTGMYYHAFTVDVRDLSNAYALHFDLYNETICKATRDVDVNDFAPFSHDAQSGPGEKVPEPSLVLLLGVGLAMVSLVGWRWRE